MRKCHSDDVASQHHSRLTHESRKKRVRVACDTCHKRKMRCDGDNPCHQCRIGISPCTYSRRRRSSQVLASEESTSTSPHQLRPNSSVPGTDHTPQSPFDIPNPETLNQDSDVSPSNFVELELVHGRDQAFRTTGTGVQTGRVQPEAVLVGFNDDLHNNGAFSIPEQSLPTRGNAQDSLANQVANFVDMDMMNDFWQMPGAVGPFVHNHSKADHDP